MDFDLANKHKKEVEQRRREAKRKLDEKKKEEEIRAAMEQEQREREENRHRQAQEERMRAEAEAHKNEGARYLARLRPYPSSRTDDKLELPPSALELPRLRRAAKICAPKDCRGRCFSTGPPLVLAVHGGAWSIPEEKKEANLAACRRAAAEGYEVLKRGSIQEALEGHLYEALDAVELAVRILEDDPSLNAGRGCSLTADGQVELDAMIMEGPSLRAGAVTGVAVTHPISLSRMVLEKTEHVLLAGAGAMRFAHEMGFDKDDTLITAEAKEEWKHWREYRKNVSSLFAGRSSPGDTVGAVALDVSGDVACGTSTGGIVGKRPGRVGDSPLLGCGGYANALGAVSATGHGEAITKVTLSRSALTRLELLNTSEADDENQCRLAAEGALKELTNCPQSGSGGLLLLSRQGEVAVAFTTQRMVWACLQGHEGHISKHCQELERQGVLEKGALLTFAVSLSSRTGGGGSTHAGVAEFTAEEGTVGVPPRVALCLTKGSGLGTLDAVGQVEIRYVRLPRCRKSKVMFQPRGEGFHAGGMKVVSLDLEHVLLETLRGHTALTQGDWLPIRHQGQTYELMVRELEPETEMALIDTDLTVESTTLSAIGSAIVTLLFYCLFSAVFFTNVEGWTTVEAIYFSMVTMSTVGYGDLAPTIWYSRMVGVAFILVGIILVFGQIGGVVGFAIEPLFDHTRELVNSVFPPVYLQITDETGHHKIRAPRRPAIFYSKALIGPIVILLLFQFVSAALFVWVEPDWDLSTALWYVMVTATTVGYGDVSVSTSNEWGLIWASLHILLSVS
eukprot:symbB.v1.2.034152.t1/scaffold4359.1/size40727/1